MTMVTRTNCEAPRLCCVAIVAVLMLALAGAPAAAQDAVPQASRPPAAAELAGEPPAAPAEGNNEATEKPRYEEKVVVTVTRTERGVEALPLSASVVTKDELARTPETPVDDVLRSLMGVNVAVGSSTTAFPSRNTLSMRGMGINRALVLLDGVPLNDPYSGYIQWNKVPVESLDRLEVVRGGSANLFGSYAMGGTINLVSRPVSAGEVDADASWGSYDTKRLSASTGTTLGKAVTVGVDLVGASSDGYNRVPEELRGPLDIPSDWESYFGRVRTDVAFSPDAHGYLTASYSSNNITAGTPLSHHDRDILDVLVGADIANVAGGSLGFKAFYQDQNYDVWNTSYTNSSKTQEYVSNFVATPINDMGGSLQWSRAGGTHLPLLTVGVDARIISADAYRQNYNAQAIPTTTQDTGGDQNSLGLFVQASWVPVPRLEVLAGARLDYWRNLDGYNRTSTGTAISYDNETSTELDPRLALRWDLGGGMGLRAAAYRSFGAPNLRDLYRSSTFRNQENVPNPALSPETSVGGEVGLDFAFWRVSGQANLYQNRLDDAILNVVVKTTPVIGIQPQNVGTARARGAELFADAFLTSRWRVGLGWAYADSTITDSPATPALEGKWITEVPRNTGTFKVEYVVPDGPLVSARMVYVSDQYADAANTLVYDAHTVVDLFASMPFTPHLEGYVAVTNLFDDQYLEDISVTTRRGAPRQVRAGIRLRTLFPGASATAAR